jgi:hypothetical protein
MVTGTRRKERRPNHSDVCLKALAIRSKIVQRCMPLEEMPWNGMEKTH